MIDCCWRSLGTSIQGTSHVRSGLPCQDSHAFHCIESEGILIASVADGAGSAKYAEIGSKLATQVVIQYLSQEEVFQQFRQDSFDWQHILKDAFQLARTALEEEAALRSITIRDLATTLLVLVSTPQKTFSTQIGDGGIVVETKEGTILAMTRPMQGEYANQTVFLVSPNSLDMIQFAIHSEILSLAMFSDGLQSVALALPAGDPHEPFFSPLFRFIKQMTNEEDAQKELEQFLNSSKLSQRTDDDKTLILATLVNSSQA